MDQGSLFGNGIQNRVSGFLYKSLKAMFCEILLAQFLRATSFFVISLVLGALLTAGVANAQKRSLKLYFLHTKEKAEITYKVNGKYIDSGLNKINRFLRDWRRNEPTKMDPQLLDLLWEVYTKSGSKDYIHVVSAYRSPATNKLLRSRSKGVAKNSQHTLGKAMDYFIPDVKLSKLREIGLKLGVGGVGYYPTSGSPFVHMDTGRVRHWPRMTRKQLVKIFPRGNTLHVPSDGKPLPGYETAVAQHKAQRNKASKIVIAKAEDVKKPGFFERLALARDKKKKDAEKATAIVATTGPAVTEDSKNDDNDADGLPLPASAPRNPGSEGGTELLLANVATDGVEEFPQSVPVPSKRPSLRPSDRLLAETRQLLVAARETGQTSEIALSPGEIENLRRSAVVSVEPARFASATPQPALLQTPANISSNQSQASLFAISAPAQAATPIASAPVEPDIAIAKPAIPSFSTANAPRPQTEVPVVALLEERPAGTELRASVDAANQLATRSPARRTTTNNLNLARPIPAAGVPGAEPQIRKAIDNVEYGYTGTIASVDQSSPAIGTSVIDVPSEKTLQLALAATQTDSSASQAIRELFDSRKKIELAARENENSETLQLSELTPLDDNLIRTGLPVPQPRPVPVAQTENGEMIVATTAPKLSGQEPVVVPMPQTPQRGYLGQWALASEIPIGMISRLSPPSYGKLAYLDIEPEYLTAGFAKVGPQYRPGRISVQKPRDLINNFTR